MPLSEFQIIKRYFEGHRLQRGDVSLGIGDDAALVSVPLGQELAIAVDTLVAGRHFPEHTSPEAIGYKALAVNLSDMAAMGAEPAWMTLSLSLPEADDAFLESFARGLHQLADQHGVQLIGGDTVRGPLVVTLQIHGFVPVGTAIRRGGAKVGDRIFVTGTLGDAGAGLLHYQDRARCDDAPSVTVLIRRLEYPQPRVAVGMALRGMASACIDVSDGLLADLGHILEASGVGAHVDASTLPLSDALRRCASSHKQAVQFALGAGDDYELCFTAPAQLEAEIRELARDLACPISCIGQIEAAPGLRVTGQGLGSELRQGYDHFSDDRHG